jgi:uncharacterized membrane protein YukC
MNYVKVAQWILVGLGVILLCLIGYGAYKYYFEKPTPNTQNISALPGSTLNVTNVENKNYEKKFHWFLGPAFMTNGDDNYVGFNGGIIW